MSVQVKAPFLRMMAVVLCAAGTCLANTGISPRPGGPDCRSATSLETSRPTLVSMASTRCSSPSALRGEGRADWRDFETTGLR